MKTLFLLFAFAALACASDLTRETTPGVVPVGCKAFVVYKWIPGENRKIEVYEMERCSDAKPSGGMMGIRYLVDSAIASVWAVRYIPVELLENVTVQKTP